MVDYQVAAIIIFGRPTNSWLASNSLSIKHRGAGQFCGLNSGQQQWRLVPRLPTKGPPTLGRCRENAVSVSLSKPIKEEFNSSKDASLRPVYQHASGRLTATYATGETLTVISALWQRWRPSLVEIVSAFGSFLLIIQEILLGTVNETNRYIKLQLAIDVWCQMMENGKSPGGKSLPPNIGAEGKGNRIGGATPLVMERNIKWRGLKRGRTVL